MSWLEQNKTLVSLATPALLAALGYVGKMVLESQYSKGFSDAKIEHTDENNAALRDAIVYRALYESCCTTEADTVSGN